MLTRALDALSGLLPREQADDLGVVVRSVDVVRSSRRGDHVEQLWAPLQDLSRSSVAFELEELTPQLSRQHDGRGPSAVAPLGDGDSGPRAFAAPGAQQRGHRARADKRLIAEEDDGALDLRPQRL